AAAPNHSDLSSTSLPLTVTDTAPSSAVTNTFIAYSNVWKYLDNGTDQGTAWRSNSFTDTSWSSGQGQLGYGDGDEFTVVEDNPTPGYQPVANDRYITTYFRKFFSVTNAAAFTNLTCRLIYDDGG